MRKGHSLPGACAETGSLGPREDILKVPGLQGASPPTNLCLLWAWHWEALGHKETATWW
jgi:hypothetical protein